MSKLNTNTKYCYRLKHILEMAKISHRTLAQHLPISASAFYQLIAYQCWPASIPQDELKTQIAQALSLYNIESNGDLWDSVQKTSPLSKGNRRIIYAKRVATPITRARIHQNGKYLALTQLELNILRRPSMLTNEIIDHLRLKFDPFREELNSAEDVLNIPEQQKVLKIMLETADRQEFIAIWSDRGAGKTTIKTIFKQRLAERPEYRVSEPGLVEKDKCTASTITDAMLLDFHYMTEYSKAFSRNRRNLEQRNRLLRQQLLYLKENGKKPVLIVDDAHLLPDETIKALKLFWEIRQGFKGILAIIMIGQNELTGRLHNYNLREVSARVRMIEMKPIPNMLEKYIRHKIEIAGGNPDKIFDPSAFAEIKRTFSAERRALVRPAMINNFARAAINVAFETGKFPMNSEIIQITYKDLETNNRS